MKTSGSGSSLTANVSAPAANSVPRLEASRLQPVLPHAVSQTLRVWLAIPLAQPIRLTANITVGATTVSMEACQLAEINTLADILQVMCC